MENTVLLIDPNNAVQAMAALALGASGIDVRALQDGSTALEVIEKLSPKVVICAKEAEGVDPLSLCKTIKQAIGFGVTAFVYLAPNDTAEDELKAIKSAGADYILTKPFKSVQLKEVVEQILFAETSKQKSDGPPILLVSRNSLCEKLIAKYLQKQAINTVTISSELDAETQANSQAFTGTIVYAQNGEKYEWYSEETMGKLILIAEEDFKLTYVKKFQNVSLLTRPLTQEDLISSIKDIYPSIRSGNQAVETALLEISECAALAAKISASIYEKLLTMPEFKEQDWKHAGQLAREELIRICKDFEDSE